MRRLAVLLCLILSPVLVRAQGRPTALELKSPEAAQSYALYMPGGGYLYTGEYGRAAIALGVTGVAAYEVIHIATCNITYETTFGGTQDCSGSSKWLWVAAAFAPYVYGIFDAGNSANRANARLQAAASRALLDMDNRGRVQLGMRFTVGAQAVTK